MATYWILSSTYLPHRGETIDFQLDDREEPVHGTFADGNFHSRWADYSVDRVTSWRKAVVDPMHEPIATQRSATPRVPAPRAWLRPLQRLARVLGVDRVGVAALPAGSGEAVDFHMPSMRVVATRPRPTKTRHDSNQISS